MWRVLHDCLPTLENLRKKSVDVQPLCQVCKVAMESVTHALATCPFSVRCWELSDLHLNYAPVLSCKEMILQLFTSTLTKDPESFCSIMWSIWNHRNLIVRENRFKTPSQVNNEASIGLFQWQQAQVTQNRQSSCFEREGLMIWQPPPSGWLTCNVDAAFLGNDGRSSYGCIVRNETGGFIAGRGGRLTGALDPRVAEALAFREALSWLKKLDFTNVYIELDCLSVVEAMRTKSQDDSFFGSIIADCSEYLKDLRSHFVYFIRRSANLAAHSMARVANSMSDHEEWFLPPSFLIDVLDKDLSY